MSPVGSAFGFHQTDDLQAVGSPASSIGTLFSIFLGSPNSSNGGNYGEFTPRLSPKPDVDNGFQSVILLAVSIFLLLL